MEYLMIIKKTPDCQILLALGYAKGKEKLAELAAKEHLPLYIASKIEFTDEKIILERKFYAGKLLNHLELPWESAVIILDDTEEYGFDYVFLKWKIKEYFIEEPAPTLNEKIKLLETKEIAGGELDITKAKIVVCIGRGIGSKEKIEIVKELAKKLGAAFGSTRPLVDIEWTSQKEQIGQTGKTIKPDIYICFGVSGAIQHQVGMNKSKYIIAVNSDPEAAIFEIADLGIVGDLFEIIPELIKKPK